MQAFNTSLEFQLKLETMFSMKLKIFCTAARDVRKLVGYAYRMPVLRRGLHKATLSLLINLNIMDTLLVCFFFPWT